MTDDLHLRYCNLYQNRKIGYIKRKIIELYVGTALLRRLRHIQIPARCQGGHMLRPCQSKSQPNHFTFPPKYEKKPTRKHHARMNEESILLRPMCNFAGLGGDLHKLIPCSESYAHQAIASANSTSKRNDHLGPRRRHINCSAL